MKTTTTVELYQDHKWEWRWRVKRKGRIVADCGEGYKRRNACLKSLLNLAIAFQEQRYVITQNGRQI